MGVPRDRPQVSAEGREEQGARLRVVEDPGVRAAQRAPLRGELVVRAAAGHRRRPARSSSRAERGGGPGP
ncbi:hypothetical protein ACFQH9_28910, partial [Pseudonocardia lutea]